MENNIEQDALVSYVLSKPEGHLLREVAIRRLQDIDKNEYRSDPFSTYSRLYRRNGYGTSKKQIGILKQLIEESNEKDIVGTQNQGNVCI